MIDINELRSDANTAHFGHMPLEIPGSEMLELIDSLEAAEKAWKISDQTVYDLTEKVIPNIQEKLEAAEKDVALKERVIDALGSELNAVANERDALRTALTDLLNDLEERATLNIEKIPRVVACGNSVYVQAKAALEAKP